jgi:hypothetical protein
MTHQEFFDGLHALGPLRIISISGPSVFEAICRLEGYGMAEGHLNAFTEAYHWHLGLQRFRHVQSHDETHARSGRRVLYFELREQADAQPFLRIYVHRAPKAEFESNREARFLAMHATLSTGVEVSS